MTGCGGTFVLAGLVLRARNGMSALPIPAGRCPETQVADQTCKLCTLILKSDKLRGCLSVRKASMAHSFLFRKQIFFFLLFSPVTLADVCSQWYRAFREAELLTCEISPSQVWLQQTNFQTKVQCLNKEEDYHIAAHIQVILCCRNLNPHCPQRLELLQQLW